MMRAGDYDRDPESGLLLPRREMRAAPQWMGGPAFFGGGGVVGPTKINMLFEAGNNTQTFTDTGAAGLTWTASGGSVITSTAHIISGVSSLQCGTANTAYLSAPTNSLGRLPPAADFSLKFSYFATSVLSAASTAATPVSLADAGLTGAGSQFMCTVNSTGQWAFYYSDGTTLTLVNPSTTNAIANADTAMEFKRVGTTLTLLQNGSAAASVTFSGSFPAVTGTWRVGCPNFNSTRGFANGMYFDNFTLTY
jgi:hypothetical protein